MLRSRIWIKAQLVNRLEIWSKLLITQEFLVVADLTMGNIYKVSRDRVDWQVILYVSKGKNKIC